jgi:hypothetical protein
MNLTPRELAFLSHHRIDEDDIYDARGTRPRDWTSIARDQGYDFVLVDPYDCGHRLRTRANACIECKHHNIAFVRRERQNGWVYLACLPRKGIIKVGCTKDPLEREQSLREQGYGQSIDWRFFAAAEVDGMGRVERDILRVIPGDRIAGTYLNRHNGQMCRELIKCRPTTAYWHFIRVVNRKSGRNVWKRTDISDL